MTFYISFFLYLPPLSTLTLMHTHNGKGSWCDDVMTLEKIKEKELSLNENVSFIEAFGIDYGTVSAMPHYILVSCSIDIYQQQFIYSYSQFSAAYPFNMQRCSRNSYICRICSQNWTNLNFSKAYFLLKICFYRRSHDTFFTIDLDLLERIKLSCK